MSKQSLESVNARLIEHFKESGIENACYYAPACPSEYWGDYHKKIAFCNLEPYNTKNDSDKVKGIVPLDEDRLYSHWFFGKTTERTFFLNYALSRCLYDNLKTTEDTLLDQRDDIKENRDLWYGNLCDDFDKSLYFNFRYTQSKTVNADNAYIDNAYRTDPFYCQHYRDFVKASEIDVLVVGGEVAVGLLGLIYPDLQGKLTYCGEPVLHDGVLFVSIPHPSRISYAEMAEAINKIVNALRK